jgi:hypothetical protein
LIVDTVYCSLTIRTCDAPHGGASRSPARARGVLFNDLEAAGEHERFFDEAL